MRDVSKRPPSYEEIAVAGKHRLSWAQLPLWLTAVGTALVLLHILYYSRYGLDFTDEGFYLVWVATPYLYDWSLSQFGYIYHPLYVLLQGNVAWLRQANVLITFGLAWLMCNVLLTSLAPETRRNPGSTAVVAAGLATASLITFESWLLTPSYNSLTLQALMVVVAGLLLAERPSRYTSLFGVFMVGLGGWLAFMGKPSTALLLALFVPVYWLLVRRLVVRKLLIAALVASCLLIVGALWIDRSIARFADRLFTAYTFAGYLGGGHSIFQILRLDDFELGRSAKSAIAILFFLSSTAMFLRRSHFAWLGAISVSSVAALFILGVIWSAGATDNAPQLGPYQAMIVFGLVLSAALYGLFVHRKQLLTYSKRWQWISVLLLVMVPHAFAFGTNGNYWSQGSHAAIFWLLAGIVALGPVAHTCGNWEFGAPIAVGTIAASALLLQTGIARPYRQPQPLWENSSYVSIASSAGPSLILPDGYAKYIRTANSVSKAAGFQSSTPVIDLTGQSPTLLFALHASNVGEAWMIGGYPGSLTLAKAALDRTSCQQIASSWVLYEPSGPRSISVEVMSSVGAVFPEEYRKAGTWTTAAGAGGYAAARVQEFYEPSAPSKTLKVCERLRSRGFQ